jgi:hypothetical protein
MRDARAQGWRIWITQPRGLSRHQADLVNVSACAHFSSVHVSCGHGQRLVPRQVPALWGKLHRLAYTLRDVAQVTYKAGRTGLRGSSIIPSSS